MTLIEASQYIRETVPTSKVISLYGYSLSRDGFMRCPFHSGDHTASLKVYDAAPNTTSTSRGWYCFGCHAGGSVIDFVMLQESCSFAAAVRAIDHALNLGLLSPEPWQDQEAFHSQQKCLDALQSLLLSQAEDRQRFLNARIAAEYASWAAIDRISKKERTADDWTRWLNLKESLDYLEFRLTRLEDFRKEVREWRNRHRLRGKTGPFKPKNQSNRAKIPRPDRPSA